MISGSDRNERRILDKAGKFGTRIGEGCTFEGTVRGGDHCTVSGNVIGDCDISGMVRIKKTGRWQGDIKADVVVIEGTVDGSVAANSKIELGHTGRVTGSLKSSIIAIAEGGTIDGEITMMSTDKITRFTERRGEPADNDDT